MALEERIIERTGKRKSLVGFPKVSCISLWCDRFSVISHEKKNDIGDTDSIKSHRVRANPFLILLQPFDYIKEKVSLWCYFSTSFLFIFNIFPF